MGRERDRELLCERRPVGLVLERDRLLNFVLKVSNRRLSSATVWVSTSKDVLLTVGPVCDASDVVAT